jgi:hypothetical protein
MEIRQAVDGFLAAPLPVLPESFSGSSRIFVRQDR